MIGERDTKTVDDLKPLQEPLKVTVVCRALLPIYHNKVGVQPSELSQIAKVDGARIIQVPPLERNQLRG
uniref:Uncharacterized protein n=1 Tax=Arundo donax TaxID=35708 RepID=A0A0A9B2F3_ARUDO